VNLLYRLGWFAVAVMFGVSLYGAQFV